jgi:type IX secretion system PorP/SprF family membrane protein
MYKIIKQSRFLPLFFTLGLTSLNAQDQHFTQFYASPLSLNPSLAGSFSGTYRMSLIYRDQWRSALENPFVTYSAAIDYRSPIRFKKRILKDFVGVGVLFYNDRVPEVGFFQNQVNLVGAYHKALNSRKNEFLSVGFQWGINQRNISYENLSFHDQFNGTNGYTLPGREGFPQNNFSFGDFAVGLHYSYAPDRSVGFYTGVAMHHILEPQLSFFQFEENPDGEADNVLYRKYTAHFGMKIPLGEHVQILPRAMGYVQGPHIALNAGSNIRFAIGDVGGAALHLGTWVRPGRDETRSVKLDAVILMGGVEYQNFLIGMSYDATMSYWGTAGRRTGAFELSLAYLGAFQNETVLCPSF